MAGMLGNPLALNLRTLVVMILVAVAIGIGPVRAGQFFDVRGVAASDVLNLRGLQPGMSRFQDAPVVGSVPHDAEDLEATGRSLEIDGSRWRELRSGDLTGWVNSRYLEPRFDRFGLAESDVLSCAGTEPFWSIELEGGQATISMPGQSGVDRRSLPIERREAGVNDRGLVHFHLAAENDAPGAGLSLIVSYSDSCSDGMSDYTFAFDAIALGLFERGPAHGCCNFR